MLLIIVQSIIRFPCSLYLIRMVHGQIIDWRQGIETCETLDELNALIHRFFQFLVTRSEPRQHECSNTAKKILTFLDENYTCPDLSIAMLSDSLSLSPSYISRIFKRETGQNVPDYIHEKRVRQA